MDDGEAELIAEQIGERDPLEIPRTVRIVALVLIAWGTLSITGLLVQIVFNRRFDLDAGFLLSLIGIGLLRRSSLARTWASLLSGFVFCGAMYGLVLNVYCLFFEKPESVVVSLGLVPCSILAVVFCFVWKNIADDKTVELYEWKPMQLKEHSVAEKKRKPIRFRISTLLYCTTLLALVCVVHRNDILYQQLDISSIRRSTTEGIIRVTHGTRRLRSDENQGIVEFVVMIISVDGNRFSASVSINSSPEGQSASLFLPDDSFIELPGESQLYEIKDGVFRSLPGSVSVKQLDAYLDQSWDGINIDDLAAMSESGALGE